MHHKVLRGLFLVCVCALSAPGQAQTSEQDEAMRQVLIGTWVVPKESSDYTGEPSRDVYRADGTTSFYIYKAENCIDAATTVDGTWNLKSGIMVATITKSSDPKKFPVGMTARAQVVNADMERVVFRALPNGEKYARQRSEGCVPVPPKKEEPADDRGGFGLGTD